ncbi:uncharacterized protein LOC110464592 isoform X2 [Mizuhopecten yessoensis]|uniref:uncharacterized protein LOC110464592 isoform X2 n=1 Tax=Mizuhopecten yessoensis TaxID=6573 RepID=UPI000B45B450|nr:uncharacterized protein LOC110464592 isoform X2 [Mizuhopecten yessoensis]
MENDAEPITGNEEEEVNTDDDAEDALLEFDDDDDGDIDMDDIRLFDETDLCSTDILQDDEITQETGIDERTDIKTPELCPFDSTPTFDDKACNQENSSAAHPIELVISDEAVSQEIIERSLSKDVLGTSQNVSSERKHIINKKSRETVSIGKDVTLPQAYELSKTTSYVHQGQVMEGQSEGQSSGPGNVPDNKRPNVVFSNMGDETDMEQTKVVSDIDDIRLIKPKVRRSPRKVDQKEAETIATVTDLNSQVVTRNGDIKARLDTQTTTPSTSRSESNSPEVIAIEDPSLGGDVEADSFSVENEQYTERGQHKCYLCEVMFNCKANLTVHMRTVHSYYPQLHPCGCTHCGAQFKSEAFVIKHEQTVHSLDTACAFCGKNQSTREALQTHVCNHLQPLTYLCMLCREDFPNVVEAEKHLSKHKGEVAFWSDFLKCRFCGSLFSKREKLYCHIMKIHEDLFNIKCKSCSQRFYLDSSLAVHRSDQNHRLDGKRIRVNDNIQIQFGVTRTGKVSKELIDISEDGSFESHNEACALKLKNSINKGGMEVSQQSHLDLLYNLGKLDHSVKDSCSPCASPRSDDDVTSQSTKGPNTITAKQCLMAKLLNRRQTPKACTTPLNDDNQEMRRSNTAPVHDSLENSFQRIMFRVASNIQELLRLSLTIEGHVTQQSHQFLAKVYDQKFKVVMVLWTELQSLTKAVNTNVFAKGNKLSKDLVDELLCGILKNVHSLRNSKVETIVMMGQCIAKSFQELIKVMIGVDTIITPGLQLIAINHYEHWLDFIPTVIDAQWNVFREIATNHTDNKNNEVLELVGRLWHARITLNQAVLLKKDENEKWKKGLHPSCEKTLVKPSEVEGQVQAKENLKQMLFKMTNETAVFVAGKSTPVAISSVEPGTKVLIPVTKLPPDKQGQSPDTVNILPGTQSSNIGDKANMFAKVAHLPGFLSNEQHEGYRLVYISEGFLREGIHPMTVSKPQQPISIDLVSDEESDDGGFENAEDNVEFSDDDCVERSGKKSDTSAEGLVMDCVEDDPITDDTERKKSKQIIEKATKVTIVTNRENDAEHMELDCVTIKPEPMDYNNITVDLCLSDDNEDDEDDEDKKEKVENDRKKDSVSVVMLDSVNNEEIKIVLAEDDDTIGNRALNTSPQVKLEKTYDGDTETSDPTQSIQSKRSLPVDEFVTGADNFMNPPNKKLKLVKVFNGATYEDTSVNNLNSLPEGGITPEPPSMLRVKTEPIREDEPDISRETTIKVKKEPVLPSYDETQLTSSVLDTAVPLKIKSEPVESAGSRPCTVAVNSEPVESVGGRPCTVAVNSEPVESAGTRPCTVAVKSEPVESAGSRPCTVAVNSEPVESVGGRPCTVAVNSMEDCKDTVQKKLNGQLDIKSERCETPLSDSEVLKAYYS